MEKSLQENKIVAFWKKIVQLGALIGLMLVTGVFYGNWISISRSYHQFSIAELVHIARVVIDNLAVPMRYSAACCLILMALSAFTENKKAPAFYCILFSMALTILAILITLVIEVPINNQIITWTASTAPSNWEAIRDRWEFFNSIRVIASLTSFVLFAIALLNPFSK